MKFFAFLLLLLPSITFADTLTFYCNYKSFSDQDGNQLVKDKFELNFIIDKSSNKSFFLGNNGSTEVQLINNPGQISFIEITNSGNIMVTTIDEKLNSVHSRNSVVLGELVPSQYYGKCIVK